MTERGSTKGEGDKDITSSDEHKSASPADEGAVSSAEVESAPGDSVEEPPKPPPTPPNQKTSKSAPNHGRGRAMLALWLALIAALVALAAAFFTWQLQTQGQGEVQELQQQLDDNAQAVAALNTHLETQLTEQKSHFEQGLQRQQQALETQLQQQQQRLGGVQQNLQGQEQTLISVQERIDGHQRRLTALATVSRDEWQLAEAEYLVKLGNQRILLEQDPSNAVSLLQAADRIVAAVAAGRGDPELFAIRQAIARDLNALRMIDPVDKEGLYLKLQSIAEAVDGLPRVPKSGLDEQTVADAAPDTTVADTWWGRFRARVRGLADSLSGYVRIDDARPNIEPLVGQEAATLAALNIRLLVEQAQVALLREEPAPYRASLERAQNLVNQYFIASAPAEALTRSLMELSGTEITRDMPNISQSAKLLSSYIEQQHKLRPVEGDAS